MSNRIAAVLSLLAARGWTPLNLSVAEIAMLSNLNTAAAAFFTAPPDIRAMSQWNGTGMWAGFQPMPEGDPAIVDLVDRFEVAASHLGSPDGQWPWVSTPATIFRAALVQVHDWAQDIVSHTVGLLADFHGSTPATAQRLWCDDDSSTLVVNSYRISEADPVAAGELMKPHTDFGGLTIIHANDGLDALQFRHNGTWQVARQSDGTDKATAVLLIGQLMAHWLGTEAPVHRVIRTPAAARMSTVFFHQPNLEAQIPGKNGKPPLHAGQHITSMQDHYNQLGIQPAVQR